MVDTKAAMTVGMMADKTAATTEAIRVVAKAAEKAGLKVVVWDKKSVAAMDCN